jgi:nucleotide-binding universal stress UspA family protein
MMNATRKDIRPFVLPVSPPRGHTGPPRTHPAGGPIIVGVEMSAAGRRAAFDAARIAAATDAPVHLVMAVNKAWSRTITGGGTEEWNINWLTTAEQFLDDLIRELPIKNVTRAVISGAPAKAVRDEAARLNARQIVVRARRTFDPFRLRTAAAAAPTSVDALL